MELSTVLSWSFRDGLPLVLEAQRVAKNSGNCNLDLNLDILPVLIMQQFIAPNITALFLLWKPYTYLTKFKLVFFFPRCYFFSFLFPLHFLLKLQDWIKLFTSKIETVLKTAKRGSDINLFIHIYISFISIVHLAGLHFKLRKIAKHTLNSEHFPKKH